MARDPGDRDERPDGARGGLSRRSFLTRMGTGLVTAGAASTAQAEEAPRALREADDLAKVALSINGRVREVLVEPRWSLSHVLREVLGMTGTKVGCERGECGACTVLIDGVPRYACMTLAVEAEGAAIVTVEGLLDGEELGATQQAFLEHDAFQCGYCTSGQIMACEGLLASTPEPTVDEIRHGMSGNLCRCGAYAHIVQAVQRAGELKRAVGGAP